MSTAKALRSRTQHPAPGTPSLRLVGTTPAAEYADVSTKTVRRWIAEGRLTGYRVGPRLIKIDLNELDAMLRPMFTAKAPVIGR